MGHARDGNFVGHPRVVGPDQIEEQRRLLPGLQKGAKRHLALEVLWNTFPIASAIRNGKIESIDNYLLTGREDGMVSFDESVRQLLRAGKITDEVARHNMRETSLLDR